jgi:predicted negative regulator of RcsB-dependent stress response
LSSALDQGLGTFERHTAMAQTMIDAGELSEAADQLEAALALRESADERARLAWVSWRLGRTDKAMSDLNMALQFEETSSDYVEQVRREISEAAEVSPP